MKFFNMSNMNRPASTRVSRVPAKWLVCLAALLCAASCQARQGKKIVFERISQYHHIQVYDEDGIRTLSFNGSWETKMSLEDRMTGHFGTTEYFQMPFIWNPDIKTVLMAGLGGGSTPGPTSIITPTSWWTWWKLTRRWSRSPRSIST